MGNLSSSDCLCYAIGWYVAVSTSLRWDAYCYYFYSVWTAYGQFVFFKLSLLCYWLVCGCIDFITVRCLLLLFLWCLGGVWAICLLQAVFAMLLVGMRLYRLHYGEMLTVIISIVFGRRMGNLSSSGCLCYAIGLYVAVSTSLRWDAYCYYFYSVWSTYGQFVFFKLSLLCQWLVWGCIDFITVRCLLLLFL